MKTSVYSRLAAHLNGDGTLNDGTTDELYRDYHRLGDDAETDLEAVEKWAVEAMQMAQVIAKARMIAKEHGLGSANHPGY